MYHKEVTPVCVHLLIMNERVSQAGSSWLALSSHQFMLLLHFKGDHFFIQKSPLPHQKKYNLCFGEVIGNSYLVMLRIRFV